MENNKKGFICLSTLFSIVLGILLLSALLNSTPLHAQSDLAKIGAYINKAQTFSADVEYVYYPTYTSQVVAERIAGRYMRKQNNSYLKIGATETITTDYYNFLIDHEEKTMDILERVKTGDISKPVGFINFDTLIDVKNEIKYRIKNAEVGICEVVSDYMEYEKVEIYYNKTSFELYKMVLYYPMQFKEELVSNGETMEVQQKADTAPRIEIVYKNIKRNEDIPDGIFSYEKYMTQKGNGIYYCKPEYKNYIIN